MKSWNSWLLSLGFAGWCLASIGCGGGDVPDPDADESSAAAPAEGPSGPNPGPGPAPAAPAAVADNSGGPAAAPGAEAAVALPAGGAAAKGGAEAAKKEEEPAPVAEGSASAAQMLALGNRPVPPSEQPAAPAGASAPGAEAPPGSSGGANVPGDPAGANIPGGSAGDSAVQQPGQTQSDQMAAQRAEMARQRGLPGGPDAGSGGPPGAIGGSGVGAGDNGPADFRTPVGAVNAFLSALRAKNPEKLAEATARRAATESKSAKNQKLFSSILEQSLTEDDLSELANKLEGFNIVGHNTPKSTGQFSIIVGKTGENGDYYSRTITTRHEKDGWKVMDIGGLGTIDRPSPGGIRRPSRSR